MSYTSFFGERPVRASPEQSEDEAEEVVIDNKPPIVAPEGWNSASSSWSAIASLPDSTDELGWQYAADFYKEDSIMARFWSSDRTGCQCRRRLWCCTFIGGADTATPPSGVAPAWALQASAVEFDPEAGLVGICVSSNNMFQLMDDEQDKSERICFCGSRSSKVESARSRRVYQTT